MRILKLAIIAVIAITSTITTHAQTAEEIVNKYVNAIGGTEAWKKVNTLITTGSMNVNGTDVSLVSTALNGKGNRQDINVMGTANYTILTTTNGWRFFPIQGQTQAEALTIEEVNEMQNQLDLQGVLVDYKAKGHTIELLSKDTVESREAFKIKITHKNSKTETVFIDTKTYLIIKSVRNQKANGQDIEVNMSFSNYQKTPEGILIPMTMQVPIGPGGTAELTITKVEINKPVDEKLFKVSK